MILDMKAEMANYCYSVQYAINNDNNQRGII